MGMEKDALICREDAARERARRVGEVCEYCGTPLLTADEKFDGECGYCNYKLNKDD